MANQQTDCGSGAALIAPEEAARLFASSEDEDDRKPSGRDEVQADAPDDAAEEAQEPARSWKHSEGDDRVLKRLRVFKEALARRELKELLEFKVQLVLRESQVLKDKQEHKVLKAF